MKEMKNTITLKGIGVDDSPISSTEVHLVAPTNYATLCGIGEEGYEEIASSKKVNCPHCLDIIAIVKEYLNPSPAIEGKISN